MDKMQQVFSNRIVLAGFTAWATAQLLKVLLTLLVSKRFDSGRILGSGGMPSSHSASVCALITALGFKEGFDSSIFAVGLLFAVIVMYDAAGVRRSTGKNAAVINKIVEGLITNGFEIDEAHLKELVGHTPLQVCVGALLGVFIGTIMS